MRRSLFLLLVLGYFPLACKQTKPQTLPYYSTADFTPQWLSEKDADTVHAIPNFSFTDQEGKAITKKYFDNKITVVDFFFTTCPGICKKLTASLAKVQQAFVGDDDVTLLSHSVTPEKDSIPILKKYAIDNGAIKNKWHLVTGKRDEIYSIARTAYFADEDMGWKQDSTTFLHTENIVLVDKHHHIRGVYKGTIPREVDELVSDIKKLQKEE